MKIKYFMHLCEFTSYTCVNLQTCYNALLYVWYGHDGYTKLFSIDFFDSAPMMLYIQEEIMRFDRKQK